MDDLPIFRRRSASSRRIAVRSAISLLCAVLLLLRTAAADAQVGDPQFGPREALVVGGPWAELTDLADAYWAKRGLRAPCPARLWAYDDSDPDTAATGLMPGCDIGVNRTWLLWVRSAQRVADRYGPRARIGRAHGRAAIQQHVLAAVCLVVVHERGHSVGQDHSPDPRSVMYWRADHPPAKCRAWAAGNWRRFARLTW